MQTILWIRQPKGIGKRNQTTQVLKEGQVAFTEEPKAVDSRQPQNIKTQECNTGSDKKSASRGDSLV